MADNHPEYDFLFDVFDPGKWQGERDDKLTALTDTYNEMLERYRRKTDDKLTKSAADLLTDVPTLNATLTDETPVRSVESVIVTAAKQRNMAPYLAARYGAQYARYSKQQAGTGPAQPEPGTDVLSR